MGTVAVSWGQDSCRLWGSMSLLPPRNAGTEPARLLSAGTGAGGGAGTMIAAAGSAPAPGRIPVRAPGAPAGRCRGWEHTELGKDVRREEKPRHGSDGAKPLAGSCLRAAAALQHQLTFGELFQRRSGVAAAPPCRALMGTGRGAEPQPDCKRPGGRRPQPPEPGRCVWLASPR